MTRLRVADNIEVMPIIDKLIAHHFPELTLTHSDSDRSEILVLFREKAAKSKGRIQLVRTRKPPVELESLGHEYNYIVEISGEHWPTLNSREREALLFRALCSMKIVEDAEKGTIKYGIVDPDVSYFFKEMDQYGDWMPRDLDEEEEEEDPNVTGSTRDPEVLEKLFGVEPVVPNDDSAMDGVIVA